MRLAQKLGIKEGMRLAIHGAPEGYAALLAPLPAGAEFISETPPEAAFLQIFVHDLAGLESLPPDLLQACGKDSLLWVTYPKVAPRSAHGLSRDIVRGEMRQRGWRAVMIVAIDGVWAALRFKRVEI